MTFIRTKENFVCEHCGAAVTGTGYTNHCPHCLYSKHVDVQPGDRAETCGGLMEPIKIEGSSPQYTIVHRCTKCSLEKRNKVTPGDSPDAVLALARKAEKSA